MKALAPDELVARVAAAHSRSLTAIGPKTAAIITDVATSGSTVYLDNLVEVALQLGDEFGAFAYGEGSLLLTRHGASIPGSPR